MFDRETQTTERAAAQARAELDRLAQASATETYTEAELKRRRDAVLADFDAVAEQQLQSVTEAGQRAQDEATRLGVDDPVARLSSEQLAEAGQRRWIVEEDATNLPYPEVLPRVRAALVGDRVTQALWQRYLGRRLEADQRAQMRTNEDGVAVARTTGQDPAMGEVYAVWRELSEKVRDPKREARLAEVQNMASEATSFERSVIRRLRLELDRGLERAQAAVRASYAQAF